MDAKESEYDYDPIHKNSNPALIAIACIYFVLSIFIVIERYELSNGVNSAITIASLIFSITEFYKSNVIFLLTRKRYENCHQKKELKQRKDNVNFWSSVICIVIIFIGFIFPDYSFTDKFLNFMVVVTFGLMYLSVYGNDFFERQLECESELEKSNRLREENEDLKKTVEKLSKFKNFNQEQESEEKKHFSVTITRITEPVEK